MINAASADFEVVGYIDDEQGLLAQCGRGSIVQGSDPPVTRFCTKRPHDEFVDHESVYRGQLIAWSDHREDGDQ